MTIHNVTAPDPGYNGNVGNVRFAAGKATIDGEKNPAELRYCQAAGYHVEEADKPEPKQEPKGDGDKPFDPADHNADEVLAYLNDADKAEAARVLDAEAAGKGRKGITNQRDAILDSKKEGEEK